MLRTVAHGRHSVRIMLLKRKPSPERRLDLSKIRLVRETARTRSKPPDHGHQRNARRALDGASSQPAFFLLCVLPLLVPDFPCEREIPSLSLQAKAE